MIPIKRTGNYTESLTLYKKCAPGCPKKVMHIGTNFTTVSSFLLALCFVASAGCGSGGNTGSEFTGYVERNATDSTGTGRYYQGREIASLIEHEDIVHWLERPSRVNSELPDRLVRSLDLKPSMHVADIGAGTGYFTFRLSPLVPYGKVHAVDIQQRMLDLIAAKSDSAGVRNVEVVHGTETDPMLPEGKIDLALIVGSYHEFYYPYEMMTNVVESLVPGGRLVLVEYRGEDATIDVPATHRLTREQMIREMEVVGLTFRESKDILPQQHFLVFEKR